MTVNTYSFKVSIPKSDEEKNTWDRNTYSKYDYVEIKTSITKLFDIAKSDK